MNADEVGRMAAAALRAGTRGSRTWSAPFNPAEPDEPLVLRHAESGREFMLELRAFEVTGAGSG